MKKLTVHLKDRSYPINIGEPLAGLGPYLAHAGFKGKLFIVTNTTVGRRGYAGAVVQSLRKAGFESAVAVIPDGERHKTLETVKDLYEQAVSAGLDRSGTVVAVGGGVVGDIAGFFAATFLRGLRFIQVPTTLLAMVDSSVGGKTGVDLPQGKNLVGAFHQPALVWVDLSVLKTLPERQLRNGLAEVIKYGIIMDARFFAALEKGLRDYTAIVYRCCALKAKVVAADERETKGLRDILNYGHTLGHAVETLTGYSGLLHGEAVAIGMVFAARLAAARNLLNPRAAERIEAVIRKAGLPVAIPGKIAPGKLIAVMRRDKKVRDGRIRFVLPTAVGKVTIDSAISESEVAAGINYAEK